MSWRDDPITEKQEALIAKMEEEACMNGAWIPPFRGTTKAEAFEYIANYLDKIHYSNYNPHEDAGDRV